MFFIILPVCFFLLLIYLTTILQSAQQHASFPLYGASFPTLLAPLAAVLDVTLPDKITSDDVILSIVDQMVEQIKILQRAVEVLTPSPEDIIEGAAPPSFRDGGEK